MKVKKLDVVMDKLRPFLKDYLEEFDTEFTGSKFTCPNHPAHRNDDMKASAAFFPGPDGFKCFACEAKGDIFTTAHYLEGKPMSGKEFITDNVLYLADMFGVEYEVEDYTEDELKREELYKVIEETCRLAHAGLKTNNEKVKIANDYIKARGWEDLVDKFQFGYCLYEKLLEILRKKGYSDESLRETGILPPENSDKNYEKYLFNDRLIFPIKNFYGRTIAVGSRILGEIKNKTDEKYLQSRNTTLYHKTNTLFNLDKARTYDKVYIVEGYADVFTLTKHGYENAVALCGLGFTEDKYKLLVKNGVQKAIFCLDNDNAGKQAIERIIREVKNLKGVEIYIKEIPESTIRHPEGDEVIKDVDDYLKHYGEESFNNIPEYTIFEWKLLKFKDNLSDDVLKADLIQIIVNEEDFTTKETLIKRLSETMAISTEAISQEVNRNTKESNNQLTTSDDILEEVNCFERVLNDWDRKIWARKGQLLGLDADKFPQLIKELDGIQNMFYIFAGNTNIGKSALLLNLATSLLKTNEDVFVLFFSIDDAVSQLLPRIIASDIDMAINTISNPKYKIKYNEDLSEQMKESMLIKRAEGIEKLKRMSDRFTLKDESQAKNIEDIEKYVNIYKKLAGDKQLVVIIDNIHRIKINKNFSRRELLMSISDNLKEWKTKYEIPVIATAEINKTYDERRPRGDDISETKSIEFDSDVVGLLYSDFHTNPETCLKFDADAKEGEDQEGVMKPIVEMNVSKNKTSGFKNKLFYKFYPEYSKYIECTNDEIKNLRRKIQGID